MSSARATTLAQGFSQRLLLEIYDKSLVDELVNRDYEGEINQIGSKLNILNFARISEKTYNGTAFSSPDSLYENNCVLLIDQWKSFYWKEKTIDNWQSYIKNPHATVVTQKADERNKNMDKFMLAKYAMVAAGNRVGTDYTTGTVTIDVNGVVAGAGGATFTAAMTGRGFKALGHTRWYRFTYTGASSGTLDDDMDDTTAYTGGVINAGATFTIEAVTPVTLTTTNLAQYVGLLKIKLDQAEKNGYNSVPDDGRNLVVPPEFEEMLTRSQGILLHVPDSFQELVKKGMITQLKGFNVFRSNRLTGNNTDGYHILAIHKNWMTFAEKLLEADIEEVLIGDFGSAYKDLFVYGAKVPDSRRSFGAELFATFSG